MASICKHRRISGIRRSGSETGFTLIEVMVVVVILGILAAMIVPKIMGKPDEARKATAKSDIRTIEQALEMYRLQNFTYPDTEQGLEALVTKPETAKNWQKGGYLKRVPKDPWGNDYKYLSPGVRSEIDIYTTGPDAQNQDDDIGNWNL